MFSADHPGLAGRFVPALVRRRGLWVGITILVLVVALGLSSRLTLRGDLQDFLPRGQSLTDPTGAGAGQRDRILVLLEAERPIAVAEAGPVLDALAARLAAAPVVRRVEHRLRPELRRFAEREGPERVLSLLTAGQLEALGERLSHEGIERILLRKGPSASLLESLLHLDPAGVDPLGVVVPALGTLGRAAGGIHLTPADGYFAVPDRRAFFLTVEPSNPIERADDARVLVGAVEAALREVRDDPRYRPKLAGKRLSAIGRPVGYVQGQAIASSDARRIVLATSVALFLLLLLFFRKPLVPLIVLGTIFFAISVTAAVAFMTLGSVSLLAWIFISVLGGLGVDCGLYVVTHYWILANPGSSRTEALASALHRPGRGILFGGLANAATFFALVVVSYPVMAELGWLSALGMLLILAASFTVLPLLLSYTEPGHAAGWDRLTRRLERRGTRHHPAWLFVWGALVVGGLWGARSLPYEPHPWKVVLEANPATEELERVRQRLGMSFTPVLMISTGASSDEALERDREAVAALRRLGPRAGVAGIRSLSGWLPTREQQGANRAWLFGQGELFSAERFRRDFLEVVSRMDAPDPALVGDYLPLVERVLTPRPDDLTLEKLRQAGLVESIERHLGEHDGEHRAVSYVYLREMPWTAGTVERFTETIEQFGGPVLTRTRFAGDTLRGGVSHARLLRNDLALASGAALLLIGGLLWFEFRRLRLVLLCLTPLVCCVSGALGLMALLGIELNVLTLAIVPLMVGLGVDNGIHVVERLNRGESLARVLAETGPAMTMTTLANAIGFGCLGLATFPGVRHVGLVGAVGLLVGLVAALQLVPLLYSILVPAGAEGRE